MNPTRRTGLLLALATAGISGVAVFLNGYGVRAFGDPTTYTTAKNLVAALVLLGIVAAAPVTGARVTRPSSPAQWAGLGLVGIIGGAIPFVLFFEGLTRAASVQAAFLHKTLVVWVAVLAVLVLRERLGPWHWAAIALLVIGQAGLGGGLLTGWGAGETMILVATLLWSAEVVLAKRLLGGLSSWTVALARMVLGSTLLVSWLVASGGAGALLAMTAQQWTWIIVTGLILAGYVSTWFAALARARAVDVTAVLVLGAIITAILAAVVQGRALAPQAGWLVVLVAGGVLIAWQAWTRPEPLAAAALPAAAPGRVLPGAP
jgi:drug/metabolite transporter (DMT)-like permease